MTGDDRSWRRLSVQRVLSVVTVALVGPVGCARAEPEDPIPFVQQLPVSQLASGYPEQPFESWLREQVGPDLEEFISWEMNDCGEGRNGMVCVAASVPANDGFSLSFNILAAGDESQVWMLYAIKQQGYRTLDVRDFQTLALALQFLRGGDEAVLVNQLTKVGVSLRKLTGPPEGDFVFQECRASFSLAPVADGYRVAFVSADAGAERVTAWWEIDSGMGLPSPIGEAPLRYTGDELTALLDRHPMLKGPWWFSSNAARTVKAPVLSASFQTLPINGERKLTLEFGVEPGLLKGPALGIVASPQIQDYREWAIRETVNPALVQAVGLALKGHGPKNAKLIRLLTIGSRIVIPVWSQTTFTTVGIWIDGYGRPHRVPGMPGVWRQEDGGYGTYVRAFNGYPRLTGLLYRREGRYSASDSYFALTESGLKRCATRTIGSD